MRAYNFRRHFRMRKWRRLRLQRDRKAGVFERAASECRHEFERLPRQVDGVRTSGLPSTVNFTCIREPCSTEIPGARNQFAGTTAPSNSLVSAA